MIVEEDDPMHEKTTSQTPQDLQITRFMDAKEIKKNEKTSQGKISIPFSLGLTYNRKKYIWHAYLILI